MIIIRQGVIHDMPSARNPDPAPGPAFAPDLAGTRLCDLALELAERSGLRVCMISYDDGSTELQVLHASPVAADPAGFTGTARELLSQIHSIASDSDVQAAAGLIHAVLCGSST
ncbi:MAG: hypothetical protein ACRDPD_11945 [Streptosporangiaceae bacterium]